MLECRYGYSDSELEEHDVAFPDGDGTRRKSEWKHKTQNANTKGIRANKDYWWVEDPIIQAWI